MKKRTKKTGASAATANFDQLCRLKRDSFNYGDFSIMTDSWTVWIGEQRAGEMPTQKAQIPRRVFNSLIRRYLEEQKFVQTLTP